MSLSLVGWFSDKLPENNRLERIWKLAQTDFRRRFYNDRLGIFWALLNPIFQVSIYYLFFTKIFKRAVEGIDNYALFLFAGIMVWIAFVENSKKCMVVLLSKKYLIESIKVNRLDLYLSSGLSSLMGFLFNLAAFLLITLFSVGFISKQVVFLPILITTLFLISVGFGMVISIIYIYVLDINHILDIVFLFGFWSSGIFFQGEMLMEIFPAFMYLNPFVGLIMNFRDVVLYDTSPDYILMLVNFLSACFLFIIGVWIVKRKSYEAFEKL